MIPRAMMHEVEHLFEFANRRSEQTTREAPESIRREMEEQLRVVKAWRARVLKVVKEHAEPDA